MADTHDEEAAAAVKAEAAKPEAVEAEAVKAVNVAAVKAEAVKAADPPDSLDFGVEQDKEEEAEGTEEDGEDWKPDVVFCPWMGEHMQTPVSRNTGFFIVNERMMQGSHGLSTWFY